MNWLITGGCGFIGRALISALLKCEGVNIRVYDNLSVGTLDELSEYGFIDVLSGESDFSKWSSKLSFLEGDIVDSEKLQSTSKNANIVVHLAANTGVGPSVSDPMADCRSNVIGTLNVLEACRHNDIKRFVFASSGAPLGVQTPPLKENMGAHPASPYGASKLAGEGYCSAYYHCFQIETVALRFGNVYGPGSSKKESVVAKFIKLALSGKQLEVYGDGSQTRDFIYIDDLVDAVRSAASVNGIGGEVFQIASATELTIGELSTRLIKELEKATDYRPELINGEVRVGYVLRNYSDTSKARVALEWSPKVSLEEGIRRTIEYFVNSDMHKVKK